MNEQFRHVIRQKIIDGLATSPPALTRRDVWMPGVQGKAIAVIGIRRAGKTSLLWQILADRLAQGARRESLLYFSFEDERLAGLQVRDLELLLEEYFRLYPEVRDQQRLALFLDEIQVVPGWEGFTRRLLDTEKIELFLSGSSARLLSREVATSMRGRAMEAVVYPYSFRESLRHQGVEPAKGPETYSRVECSQLDKALDGYLVCGGFPEAQGLDIRNRFELLRGYIDVVLLRDIVERHAISQPLVLRWMVRSLLCNAAGPFSVNKFYNDLKSQHMAVGKDTLYAFLSHLEDVFLVRSLSIATDSEHRRRINLRKIYPIDPGLIPVFDRSEKRNIGHSLETVILLELDRLGAEVSYVRTGNGFEIDFLARYPDGKSELIQVCANLDTLETRKREFRALLDGAGEYPDARLLLLTLEKPSVMEVPARISIKTARDWLLEEPRHTS